MTVTSFDPKCWALGLYATVLDGGQIEPLLYQLAVGLGASRVIAFRTHFPETANGSHDRLGSHNIDPAALKDYAGHWASQDPWVKAAANKPWGTYDMRELVPEYDVVRTSFWGDFLQPHKQSLYGLTTFVEQREEVTGVLTLWRENQAGHFPPSALALLRVLEPHVRRAFFAEARLSQGNLMQGTLDTMPEGVAVIGSSSRLLHVNAALQAMARQADGLGLAPQGVVVGSPALQQALDHLVGLALRAAQHGGALAAGEGRLVLPRPSGGAPWLIDALPLPAARDGRFGGQPGVVLLVADRQARRAPSEKLLSRTYGLTPSEAALAGSLLEGVSLAEHARRRRIAMPTARTHLARVLEKTGCRRQADLVAKLSRTLG